MPIIEGQEKGMYLQPTFLFKQFNYFFNLCELWTNLFTPTRN